MKNFLIIFSAAFLAAASSHATGLFVGADALFSNARHEAKNSSATGAQNGNKKEDAQMGYSLNAGVRADFLALLVSGEVFYDSLNTSSRGFDLRSGTNNNDSIELKNRYGAKANIGFAILPRVTPFLTFGLANVNYSSSLVSSSQSSSKSQMTPLYGLGLLIDLPFDISLKAAYDYQQFNMRYADSSKVRTHLGVARLGVVYNF